MEEGKDYTGGYVFNIEYNHVHDWGSGIVSDFGAIHSSAKEPFSPGRAAAAVGPA